MKNGVLILGLNGSGKTTVGRIVSERTGLCRADAEDFYFPDGLDGKARGTEEAMCVLSRTIAAQEGFVLSAVRADLPSEVLSRVTLAVVLSAPREERLERLRRRSLERFGARILPGGGRYEAEEAFFMKCAARTESTVWDSLKGLECPVLRLDALRSPEKTADDIIRILEE